MTKNPNEQTEGAAEDLAQEPAAAAQGDPAAPAIDPTQSGINALRAAGLEPLRMWKTKAPKDVGGTIGAVFLQATSQIVIMHQLDGGKYALFGKISLDSLTDE